jgi:predicted dehydrogenase
MTIAGEDGRIGIAVIGAGFIADYHLAGLADLPEAVVRAVVSRRAASAEALAARFAVAEATTDLAAVLARPDIQAVVVTTPDDTHEAIATAALQAGKAVLLQKPMATDSAACRRLRETARATGADLKVSWMHRHFPEVEEASRLLASDAIGRVTSARLRNATPGPDWADWFFKRERVEGGVVLQLGSHGIDLVQHLLGPVVSLGASTAILQPERRLVDGRVVRVENPDSAWATYELACGAVVSHEMSMIEVAGCDRFRLELYGTEGTIWLRSERGPLAYYRQDAPGWVTPDLDSTPVGVRQHRQWIAALVGREPADDSAEAGLHGLLVAEAIARSAASGGATVGIAEGGG